MISAAAGLLRLPLKQFSLWTFYGTIPRCLFLGYLGWGMGETYQGIAKGIDKAEGIVSGLIIVCDHRGDHLVARPRARQDSRQRLTHDNLDDPALNPAHSEPISQPRKSPKPTLAKPAMTRIQRFISVKRCAVRINGRLMMPLKSNIPPTEPKPKMTI